MPARATAELQRLFVDFNSYFASVEQQETPALRGQPVVVVPVMADTTCCIAASYEARRYGIRTGTAVGEARRLCPGLHLVLARHALYVEYHHRLMALVDSVLPIVAVMSIDEVLCELPRRWQQPDTARDKALEIKRRIAAGAGAWLKCSIGIAPNGFLAKTAAEMQKPDGLTLIQLSDLPNKLLSLSLRDFSGIGPSLEKRLNRAGIHSTAELWAASRPQLRKIWGGIGGEIFHDHLRGLELPAPAAERRSIGHSHVLPPAERNEPLAHAVIHRLLQKAALRLREMGLSAGHLAVHVRFAGRPSWHCDLAIAQTDDTAEFTRTLDSAWASQRPMLRRLKPLAVGVTLSALKPLSDGQPDLFQTARKTRLNQATDQAHRRFGKNAVYLGGSHQAREAAPMRIAFSRIPDVRLEH